MLTFIVLNLYHLTDSKAQLNINKVHNFKSNHIARSNQRRCRSDRKAMVDRLLQTSKFELFPEGGNRCCTACIFRRVIPNLKSVKGKTMAKVFD